MFYVKIAHMSYYVTTSDPTRRARWQRLFGVDRLPVLHPRPRWRVGRGELREVEYLAYDLDATRLHWMAQRRAAQLIGDELHGLPIKAGADVEVETAVSPEWVKRPFVFGHEQGAAYGAA